MLLQCGHMFCETCLHFWSKVNSACPYCRSQIQGKVRVPIDSFMVEMCKLILSNCNMKRSKLKSSESSNDTDNTDIMRFMKISIKPINVTLYLPQRLHVRPFLKLLIQEQ